MIPNDVCAQCHRLHCTECLLTLCLTCQCPVSWCRDKLDNIGYGDYCVACLTLVQPQLGNDPMIPSHEKAQAQQQAVARIQQHRQSRPSCETLIGNMVPRCDRFDAQHQTEIWSKPIQDPHTFEYQRVKLVCEHKCGPQCTLVLNATHGFSVYAFSGLNQTQVDEFQDLCAYLTQLTQPTNVNAATYCLESAMSSHKRVVIQIQIQIQIQSVTAQTEPDLRQENTMTIYDGSTVVSRTCLHGANSDPHFWQQLQTWTK